MIEREEVERHHENFELAKFEAAQEKAKEVIERAAALVEPGMRESEAYKILAKEFRAAGTRKFWHPLHVRFGENTLLGYREKEKVDPVLKENDVFFFDVAPLFNQHEADYGKTFFVGEDPLYKKISEDVKEIYERVRKAWKEKGLTGIELYDFMAKEVQSLGWTLGPSYVKSHRISTFPHNLITNNKMSELEFSPGANRWILEVQIRHPEKAFGAFYEDVL